MAFHNVQPVVIPVLCQQCPGIVLFAEAFQQFTPGHKRSGVFIFIRQLRREFDVCSFQHSNVSLVSQTPQQRKPIPGQQFLRIQDRGSFSETIEYDRLSFQTRIEFALAG